MGFNSAFIGLITWHNGRKLDYVTFSVEATSSGTFGSTFVPVVQLIKFGEQETDRLQTRDRTIPVGIWRKRPTSPPQPPPVLLLLLVVVVMVVVMMNTIACPSVALRSTSKTLTVSNLEMLLLPLNATQKFDCHIHRNPWNVFIWFLIALSIRAKLYITLVVRYAVVNCVPEKRCPNTHRSIMVQ